MQGKSKYLAMPKTRWPSQSLGLNPELLNLSPQCYPLDQQMVYLDGHPLNNTIKITIKWMIAKNSNGYLTFWIQAEFVTSIPQILRFLSFSVIVVLLEENPNLKKTALISVSRKKCGCNFVYIYLLWEKVNITQSNHFFYNRDWCLAGIYLAAMKMQAFETSCCLADWLAWWLAPMHSSRIALIC